MELKEYQQKTLDQVKGYLTLLDEWKKRHWQPITKLLLKNSNRRRQNTFGS